MPEPRPALRVPRPGFSLPELLVAVTIVGVLVAFAIRPLSLAADRMAVRAAAAELSTLFADARERAVATRSTVAVVIDTARGIVAVRAHDSTMAIGDARRTHGVELAASRDSMSYDPRGLGFGAANLSLLVRRGRVAETLSVSRLGRVRR